MLNNKVANGNKNLVVLFTGAEQVVDEACVVATIRPLELRFVLSERDGGFHRCLLFLFLFILFSI